MITPRTYVLMTPDGCSIFDRYSNAILEYVKLRDQYDAILLVEFGGQRQSHRIAEKWARDGWTAQIEPP